MKTKHLFGLVAAVAVSGLASTAQAGLSIGFVFGLPVPVVQPSRVVVVTPTPCPPPVVQCPPAVVYHPVVPCRPVMFVAPRRDRYCDYRDQHGYDHRRSGSEERGHRHEGRGQDRGGRR